MLDLFWSDQYINIYEFDMLICSNVPLYILDYQENEVDFRLLYSNEEEYSDILMRDKVELLLHKMKL